MYSLGFCLTKSSRFLKQPENKKFIVGLKKVKLYGVML